MLGFVTLDPSEPDPKVEAKQEPLPRFKRQNSAQKLQEHIEQKRQELKKLKARPFDFGPIEKDEAPQVQAAPTPTAKPPSLLGKLPSLEDGSAGRRIKTFGSGGDTPGFRSRQGDDSPKHVEEFRLEDPVPEFKRIVSIGEVKEPSPKKEPEIHKHALVQPGVSPIVTKFLRKTIRHPLKNSTTDFIEYVEAPTPAIQISLAKQGKTLIIDPAKQIMTVESAAKTSVFHLNKLPSKLKVWLQYADNFVRVLYSKTPWHSYV